MVHRWKDIIKQIICYHTLLKVNLPWQAHLGSLFCTRLVIKVIYKVCHRTQKPGKYSEYLAIQKSTPYSCWTYQFIRKVNRCVLKRQFLLKDDARNYLHCRVKLSTTTYITPIIYKKTCSKQFKMNQISLMTNQLTLRKFKIDHSSWLFFVFPYQLRQEILEHIWNKIIRIEIRAWKIIRDIK